MKFKGRILNQLENMWLEPVKGKSIEIDEMLEDAFYTITGDIMYLSSENNHHEIKNWDTNSYADWSIKE